MCCFSLTDRRLIMPETKSFDSNSTTTTLKETRIDNRIERSSSLSSRKYQKMPIVRQTSIDHAPDVSNNNQDVIYNNSNFNCPLLSFCRLTIISVYCGFVTRAAIRYQRFDFIEIRHGSESTKFTIIDDGPLRQCRNIIAVRCANEKNDRACATSQGHSMQR